MVSKGFAILTLALLSFGIVFVADAYPSFACGTNCPSTTSTSTTVTVSTSTSATSTTSTSNYESITIIATGPNGAVVVPVSVDGVSKGQSPVTLQLAAGSYSIACGPSAGLVGQTTGIALTILTVGGSAQYACTYTAPPPGISVTATDAQGNLLFAQVFDNGNLLGTTPKSVTGNIGDVLTCGPIQGYLATGNNAYTVTSAAAQTFTCTYSATQVNTSGGQVGLIVNTYEPGYGAYQYGQIQITSYANPNILIIAGNTGQSGSATYSVPSSMTVSVNWIGVCGTSSPVASQMVNTGTSTQTVTLQANPAFCGSLVHLSIIGGATHGALSPFYELIIGILAMLSAIPVGAVAYVKGD